MSAENKFDVDLLYWEVEGRVRDFISDDLFSPGHWDDFEDNPFDDFDEFLQYLRDNFTVATIVEYTGND